MTQKSEDVPKWLTERTDMITKGWISNLQNMSDEEIKKWKTTVGYKNSNDYWLGYLIGAIESHMMQEFYKEYDRGISVEEKVTLQEIIGVHKDEILDALNKLKSRF